jgi:hypothetical protein
LAKKLLAWTEMVEGTSAYDEEIDLQGLPEATIETIPDHSVHKLPDSIRLPAQV